MEVKMSKNGHFQHFHRFPCFGQFSANFCNFQTAQKISEHNFHLLSFFLSISLLSKAGEKQLLGSKGFIFPAFQPSRNGLKWLKNGWRGKKSSPGRHSALVTVRSCQSGNGICQNLCKNQAVLMVLNFNLYDIHGTLQVRICKVSNLARGPCIYNDLYTLDLSLWPQI